MENKGMGIQICLVCKKEVSQFIALMGEFHPISEMDDMTQEHSKAEKQPPERVILTFTVNGEKKEVVISHKKLEQLMQKHAQPPPSPVKPKTVKLYMCPHCGNIIGQYEVEKEELAEEIKKSGKE